MREGTPDIPICIDVKQCRIDRVFVFLSIAVIVTKVQCSAALGLTGGSVSSQSLLSETVPGCGASHHRLEGVPITVAIQIEVIGVHGSLIDLSVTGVVLSIADFRGTRILSIAEIVAVVWIVHRPTGCVPVMIV